MEFEWDEAKSEQTRQERGFDFAFAARIFESYVIERADDRMDYGEERVIAIGQVEGIVLVVVYTDRDGFRRIISCRRANRRERDVYSEEID